MPPVVSEVRPHSLLQPTSISDSLSVTMKMSPFLVPSAGFLHVGICKCIFGAGGLLIGLLAVLFAAAVVAFALAVSAAAVVGALMLTGLILLAVALPFLAPIIVVLVVVILATRHSNRRNVA